MQLGPLSTQLFSDQSQTSALLPFGPLAYSQRSKTLALTIHKIFRLAGVQFQSEYFLLFKPYTFAFNPTLFLFNPNNTVLFACFKSTLRIQRFFQTTFFQVRLIKIDSSTAIVKRQVFEHLDGDTFYHALRVLLTKYPNLQTVRFEDRGEVAADLLNDIVNYCFQPHPQNIVRVAQFIKRLHLNLRAAHQEHSLFIAIAMQRIDICQQLLPMVNPNLVDCQGRYLLQYACALGHKRLIQLLLAKGADIHCRGSHYDPPLFQILYSSIPQRKKVELFKVFAERGADIYAVNLKQQSLALVAFHKYHYKIVRYLVECGIDNELTDPSKPDLICHLIAAGQIDILKRLAAKGNKFGQPHYLSLAAICGYPQIMAFFIEQGAHVNACEMDAKMILLVLPSYQKLIAKRLLENGKILQDVFYNNFSPLMWACAAKQSRSVLTLIRAGADVNLNVNGYTALHLALKLAFKRIVKILLVYGATIEAEIDGSKPLNLGLRYACLENNLDQVKELIKRGAKVEPSLEQALSPLKLAIYHRHLTIAEYLIDKGANPLLKPSYLLKSIQQKESSLVDLKKLWITNPRFKATLKKFKSDRNYQQEAELLKRRLIANAFELDIETYCWITGSHYRLIGLNPPGNYAIKCMFKHLSALQRQWPFHAVCPEQISKALETYLSHPSPEKIGLMLQSKIPVILEIGFEGHLAYLVICDGFFIIVNRGGGNRNGKAFEIFTFNLAHLNPKVLQQLIGKCKGTQDNYLKKIQHLENSLSLKKTDQTKVLEAIIDIHLQTVGNCPYANAEGVVLALFVFQAEFIKRFEQMSTAELFIWPEGRKRDCEKWHEVFRYTILQNYLIKRNKTSNQIAPDLNLVSKAIEKMSPANQIILRKCLENFQNSQINNVNEKVTLSFDNN